MCGSPDITRRLEVIDRLLKRHCNGFRTRVLKFIHLRGNRVDLARWSDTAWMTVLRADGADGTRHR